MTNVLRSAIKVAERRDAAFVASANSTSLGLTSKLMVMGERSGIAKSYPAAKFGHGAPIGTVR
jgi:hypothetical protein